MPPAGDARSPRVPAALLRAGVAHAVRRRMSDAPLRHPGQRPAGRRRCPTPASSATVAERAEELGYDSIWAGDHISFREPDPRRHGRAVGVRRRRRSGSRSARASCSCRCATRRSSRRSSPRSTTSPAGGSILGVGVGGEGGKDFEAVGVPARARRAHGRGDGGAPRALPRTPGELLGALLLVRGRRDRARRRRSRADRRSGSAVARRRHPRAAALGDGWMPIWVSPERFAEGWATSAPCRRPGATRTRSSGRGLPALVGDRCGARLRSTCRSATRASSRRTSSTATASRARPSGARPGCGSTSTPGPGTSSSTSLRPGGLVEQAERLRGGPICCRSLTSA